MSRCLSPADLGKVPLYALIGRARDDQPNATESRLMRAFLFLRKLAPRH
jgi:hypothetical protein